MTTTSISASAVKSTALISIFGIVIVALALRPSIVSIGPVLPLIKEHFGLAHWSASLLTSIPDLLMGLLALPTPWLARRFGRDTLVVFALVLLTLSTAWRSTVGNVAFLLASTTGVGIGIAIAGALLSGFIKERFASKAAVVIGIYTTALSLGSFASAVSTAPIAGESGDWRLAIGIWAVLGLLAIASWLIVMSRGKDSSTKNKAVEIHVPLPWGNLAAWRIAAYFACVNLIFYAIVAWTAAIYTEYGIAPNIAGMLLGSFTLAFTLSSAAVGFLSKSTDRRGWLAACSAISVIGLLIMAVYPSWYPIAAVIITAIGLGGAFTLSMTLPLDNTKTVTATNVWTAFTLTIGYLIAALGPFAVGILRDITGNYYASSLLLVAVACVMFVLAPFLKPVNVSTMS